MYVYSYTGATPHIFGIQTRTLHASFYTVIVTTRSVPSHIHTLMTLPYSINRAAALPPLSPIQLLRVAHPLWRRIIQNFLCGHNDPPIPCHSWIQPQASYLETQSQLRFSRQPHHLSSDPLVFLVTLYPHSPSKVSTRRVLGALLLFLRTLYAPQYSPSLTALAKTSRRVKDTFWTLT